MNVDEFVVQASQGRELPSLRQLTEVMAEWVGVLEDAGLNPTQDPAVLLLGGYISFHTQSDINTVGGYRRLVQQCEDRLHANRNSNDAH